MDEDLVVMAMRSVFSVRQALSEQALNGSRQEVQTPKGKIYVGGYSGSAFCFNKEDGLLVTCEHVRQDMHKESYLTEEGLPTELSRQPAFVVVWNHSTKGRDDIAASAGALTHGARPFAASPSE